MCADLLNPDVREREAHAPPGAWGEEALRAYLLGTILSARATLAVSTALAALIALAAQAATGAWIFLALAFALVVIGLGRYARLSAYQEREQAGLTQRDIVDCDNVLALWSTLYALALGIICAALTLRAGSDTLALALSVCTGYTLAFAMRSAGRPWTMRLQIVAVTGPQICALLSGAVSHGPIYAALVLALVGASLSMGRDGHERIVALFRADESNRRMARRDMLTGAMNRFALTQVFANATAGAQRRPDETIAIYLLDLDRFKAINDTYGHAMGDAVIVETAKRLRQAAEGYAEVARMGGDEFMLIARAERSDAGRIAAFAEAILDRLGAPFEFEGNLVPLAGSVGVAIYPQHGRDMADLMTHADCALYEAKREGRGRFRLFDESMRSRLAEDRRLEVEFDEALREDGLEVWYQPIRNMRSGAVAGYEALARWRHPVLGLVPPDRFVRIAEQSGAIHRLGEVVLERACREAAAWDPRVSLSVNLSPQQFRRPAHLVEAVKRALVRSGLEPSQLYLEITESTLLEDTPQTRKAVSDLAGCGVKFSLDDFGAGYSSLAYIQNYPFSNIKIDRKFVESIHSDRVASAIVASVCVLAARIQMTVVAEGVETQAQQRSLVELGVELAQGYLYGRPAPMARTATLPHVALLADRFAGARGSG
jgi:diguanylate cyclase (GGDEF)-like protein